MKKIQKIQTINESFNKMFTDILGESFEFELSFYETFYNPFIEILEKDRSLEFTATGAGDFEVVYHDLGAECEETSWYDPGTIYRNGYWERADEPGESTVSWIVDDWTFNISDIGVQEVLEDYFMKKLGLDRHSKKDLRLFYTRENRQKLLENFNAKEFYKYLLDCFREDAIDDAQTWAEPPEEEDRDDFDY